MKRILFATAIAAAAACSIGSAQAAQVGVSVGFAAPGAYGRVDIGRFPTPALVSRSPVVVGARLAVRDPLYLWVPYEHRVRWADYCASYGACGQPVYFVDDGWYRQNVYSYAPRPVGYWYGGRPYYPNGYWRDGDRDDRRWHDRDDWRDHDHDHGHDGDGHPYRPYYPYPPGPPGSHGGNGGGNGDGSPGGGNGGGNGSPGGGNGGNGGWHHGNGHGY